MVENMEGIDTDLYSRQIGTFGFEMMGKIQKLNVLIIGIKASGIEIAKNLALMGVESICVYDNDPVQVKDLGVNFFARESDLGKPSSAACLPHLRDLNRNVTIRSYTGDITEDLILEYDVVVCCDQSFDLLKAVNEKCRANKKNKRVGFISADTFGMVGAIFVDFGPSFTCVDPSGRELKTAIVEGITNAKEGSVHVHIDKVMDFQTGDYVRFSEVEGMVELNSADPVPIKVVSKDSFLVGDTREFSQYTSGGIVTEVRMPKKIDFRSFNDCILDPSKTGLMTMDYSLFGRAEQLHWISMAYRMGGDVLGGCKDLNSRGVSCTVEAIDEKVMGTFVKQAHLRVPPLASFVGGVVAHEVIKFTGKYHPIEQWLYCDFTLPPEFSGDGTGAGSRYADQIAIWGQEVQNKLQNAKIFIVGSGALGCEFMKNFALLGCGTQKEGSITITDNDRIEMSNISRQFLFRSRHIGMSKSKVASDAAVDINPNCKINPLEVRVGEESEDIFDEQFWSSLTIVVNALDNIQARQYVDGRCVWYEKPLIESGTLGTLGNVQVVIPHLTQCYSETQDPPETSIPLCTLKHFPYQVEHTIEWARDVFEGLFTQIPQDLKKICNNEDDIHDIPAERLKLILNLLTLDKAHVKEGLLKISAELFNQYFVNDIQQLLYSFPKDHVTSEGQKFWSPPKRVPSPLTFSLEDKVVSTFIIAASQVFSQMLGLTIEVFPSDLTCLGDLVFPEFAPRVIKLSQDNLNLEIEKVSVDTSLLNTIRSHQKTSLSLVQFEKDDDTNFHVDFIWAAAVLRCRNYSIQECDKMKAKLISGKIIPAIATTTAMIGGLVTLEFIKAIMYKSLKIDHFRNAFCCLATPIFLQSEPLPPNQTKDKDYDPVTGGPVRALPENFTVWNKLVVLIPNGTVKQLIDWIRSRFNIEVIILSAGNLCIYNSFLPAHKASRLTQPITQLVETLGKKPLDPKSSHLVIDASCTDQDDVDVVIPTIKFEFR
ncbi:ubiquitin-protein ligase, putative [Theileria equi strain WA]|uniref:Ubiquitin-protein ligase, putative n=1 Tax=Theileria equi strain WA TaxID=1537102 RepID=L0AXB0_THEEQ|nr:ubiquitin-protein ligase, putative [Theileria equi strain WA]AFZ79661.1 ubiquitin-protein ligase, putative [Theileria equi strain WA]|eukprot:XP_004829327.1 ubiquitin-protein ligase, putative [Theileria equi strain WA]